MEIHVTEEDFHAYEKLDSLIRIRVNEIFDKLRRAELLEREIDVYLRNFRVCGDELILYYIPLLSSSIKVFYFPLSYVNRVEDFINESEYAKYMSFLETKEKLNNKDAELFVELKEKFEKQ